MSVRLNLRETIEYAIENHIPDCPPDVAELISQQVADTLTCDLVTLVWGSPGHVETVNFGGGEYATSLRLNERGRSVVLDALHSLEEVQSEWSTPYVASEQDLVMRDRTHEDQSWPGAEQYWEGTQDASESAVAILTVRADRIRAEERSSHEH